MLIQRRIYGDSLVSLQPDSTPPNLKTNVMLNPESSVPELDQMIAFRAYKMVENEEKIRFSLLKENSPTFTFKEALNNDSTDIGPVPCRDKQQRAP
jgi:hypothetical protein